MKPIHAFVELLLRILRLLTEVRVEGGEGERAKSLSPFPNRNNYIPFWSSAPPTEKEREKKMSECDSTGESPTPLASFLTSNYFPAGNQGG